MSQPDAFVYIDVGTATRSVGRLWVTVKPGRQSAELEFDEGWIADPLHFALGPSLNPGPGRFRTLEGHTLFGPIGDSAPDRWGRRLLVRAEVLRARTQQTTPRTLREIDYLLGVSDLTRQGALRFSLEPGGPFLTATEKSQVPPLIRLGELMNAAMALDADPLSREADQAVRLLLAPGSSLGGARPKASVYDLDGVLAIAKFPKQDDEIEVVRWEYLMLRLATIAGIDVPLSRLVDVGNRKVLVVRRFDRQEGVRVPFLSAMSLLDSRDGDIRSYAEIAEELRRHQGPGQRNGPALYRRIVFNILASNFDDHLRNHAVLFDGSGWNLSPAYDLNPVPLLVKRRELSTAIGFDGDVTASIEHAVEEAESFDLQHEEARVIAGEVAKAVATWRTEAKLMGLRSSEVEYMETAFEHPDAEIARRW